LIDRLAEEVRAEKRVDLELLAEQRVFRRRVMGQRDADIALHALQRVQQLTRRVLRMTNERLHLELAELRAACPGETAAEAFDAGDADAPAGELEHDVLAFEHGDADALEVG